MDRPHHIWPRLKDLVRFPNATFLQHTSGRMPFSHFVCLRAAHLALLSVMSRVGSRVLDLLPSCLPLVGRNGRSNPPRLFLRARQWHYTVFAIGMLDIPRMGTVVFPVCHFFACMRHDAAGCHADYLTEDKSKIES